MITLWGRANSANVQKPLWALDELNVPFERIDAGGAFGKLDTPEYRKLNPNMRVPTLIDGDLVVWESNAVTRYLAARYGEGALYPTSPVRRAMADMWMDWEASTVAPAIRPVFWGLIRTPEAERDMAAIDAAAAELGEIFSRLDAHLADKAYVGGDAFTMGDIPVGVMAYRYFSLDIHRPNQPNLAAWYERLRSRPAYAKYIMIPMT